MELTKINKMMMIVTLMKTVKMMKVLGLTARLMMMEAIVEMMTLKETQIDSIFIIHN